MLFAWPGRAHLRGSLALRTTMLTCGEVATFRETHFRGSCLSRVRKHYGVSQV